MRLEKGYLHISFFHQRDTKEQHTITKTSSQNELAESLTLSVAATHTVDRILYTIV